jgi:hypothetical protein
VSRFGFIQKRITFQEFSKRICPLLWGSLAAQLMVYVPHIVLQKDERSKTLSSMEFSPQIFEALILQNYLLAATNS